MTYVIAQPCIDVKDKACAGECPVDCICEGERMLCIHPGERAGCGACEPCARSRRSSAKTTCPGVGPVHRREREVLRPARLARRRGQDGPLPYDTDYVANYVTGR
jgi:hypothetical protein